MAGGAAGLRPQKLAFSQEKWPRIKMGCKRSPDGFGAPNLYPRLQGPAQAGYRPEPFTRAADKALSLPSSHWHLTRLSLWGWYDYYPSSMGGVGWDLDPSPAVVPKAWFLEQQQQLLLLRTC